LLNKTRRYLIYMFLTVGFAVLGNFTSLLLPSYFWGLTYGTLGLILSIVMEMYIELAVREEPQLQVILEEDRLRELARKMKTDPSCRSMKAMWCTRETYMPQYFDEEEAILRRNPRLHIQRLVNPDRVEEDYYKAHVQSSRALVDQGRYEIRNTNMKEFEYAIWEFEKPTGIEHKAVFVFNDMASNTLGLAVFLDPTRHEKVRSAVRAIDSWFEHEWLACAQPAMSKKPQTF
jgi:hypothetical protein